MQNKILIRTVLSIAVSVALAACHSTEEADAGSDPGSIASGSAAAPTAAPVAAQDRNVAAGSLDEITVTGSRVSAAGSASASATRPAQESEQRRERFLRQSAMVAPSYNSSGQPAWTQPNTESYAELADNGIKRTSNEPVSTFSIDVDTGSYSNVRRLLSEGQLPPADAVRTEELVNYFAYDYPDTAEDEPFSVVTEMAASPWHEGRHLLHIGIEAREPQAEAERHSNLVFLVDVSGSMADADKLPLLVTSLKLLSRQLTEDDSIALVVYAGASGVVLEPTPGNATATITNALDRLYAGGSTNGAAGIELAYDLAQQHFIEGGINRVLLATDGDFNVGMTDFDALQNLIEDKRKTGISLTTLGFGTGNYNDHLMEQLADAGNGNYAYIDSINEARKVLVDEVASTLQTVAKDVKIQIEFNPGVVSEYRLVGYENRILATEDFNNDKVDAGEIGAGHTVTALYEISLVGSAGGHSVDPLRYGSAEAAAEPVAGDEMAYLKLRYKEPEGSTSRLMERSLLVRDIKGELNGTSASYRFAAAVAGFGQLLRGNDALGDFDYDDVLALATAAREDDSFGYRAEFISLVKTAQALSTN